MAHVSCWWPTRLRCAELGILRHVGKAVLLPPLCCKLLLVHFHPWYIVLYALQSRITTRLAFADQVPETKCSLPLSAEAPFAPDIRLDMLRLS